MEKRLRFTVILVLILVVLAAFSSQSAHKKEKLVFSRSLDKVVLCVDEKELTLGDIAFYVAYEEKTIQEQAVVYNPEHPNQYWNLHTDGQFIKVSAKQAAIDMAVHDEIFYELAVSEKITLDAAETEYLANDQTDFWSDLSDWQRQQLGISEKELDDQMEKIALANKDQSIYAQMNGREYEAYNFDGDAYEKLLTEHKYEIKEDVWDRVDFGNITLDNY